MTSIVLVHGAWCDGSSWSRVIPPLLDADHEVVAVQNPMTSLHDDVATTRKVIASLEGPVVLVGHSYGGAVITAAAEAESVSALVYVAAYAPDEGETVQSIGDRFDPTPGPATIGADDEGYLLLARATFGEVFAADLPEGEARVLAAVQRPTHASCFGEPVGTPAWRTVPSWYVRSTDDKMVHPDAQAWLAERMGATTSSLVSSHASPVSHPRDVADVVLTAAAHR